MRKLIFTIYDSKAEFYGLPIFADSKGSLIRDFADVVNDGKSVYSKHPEDYTLFCIGEYDTIHGIIELYEAKQSVVSAIELKRGDE